MKHYSLVAFACAVGAITFSHAELVPQQVSYSGYKVVRVPIGNETSHIVDVIERLELETWREPHEAGAFADVVVPPEKL